MHIKAPLFFAVFFSFLLIPFVHAEEMCNGEVCLTFNQTHSLSYDCDYIDMNETHFFCGEPFGIDNDIYIYNSTWDLIQSFNTVTVAGKGYTNGLTLNNDTYSPSELVITHSVSLTNYFYRFNLTPALTHQIEKGRQYEAGLDWYGGYYFIHDDAGGLYRLNTAYDETHLCSVVQHEGGVHHLFGSDKIFIILEQSNPDQLVLYDIPSCSVLSTIDVTDFTSVHNARGVTGNSDNTKLFIGSDDKVYEFDIDVNITPSTLFPISPLEGSDFVDNIIVMELQLNAGLNGTLFCFINTALEYQEDYENGTHSIDFSSGELPDGENNWTCGFLDSANNSWLFDPLYITFSISTGIMNTAGSAFADLFGFETDDYSTATEKGRAFLALIITFAVALGIGGYFKSAEIAGMGIISFLIIFTFTGDLPAWIGILLIILSGFIMVEWVRRLHTPK